MNISSAVELGCEMVSVTESEEAVPMVCRVKPHGRIVVLPPEPHARSAGPVSVVEELVVDVLARAVMLCEPWPEELELELELELDVVEVHPYAESHKLIAVIGYKYVVLSLPV